MDLNLYLGLPRSPSRRESDLGADLALNSSPSSAEEACSTEMSGRVPEREAHAPYSPNHALITPSFPPVEPSNSNEESPILHFEHAPYTPPPPPLPSYRSMVQSSMKPNSSSHAEYCPCPPSVAPASPATDRRGIEHLGPDAGDPSGHAPYSPSYAPISPAMEDIIEPVVEGDSSRSARVEHVPYSPSHAQMSPVALSSLQGGEALAPEDGVPHGPYSPSYFPVSVITQMDEGHSNVGNPLPPVAVDLLEAALPASDLLAQEEASRRDLFQYPEVRLRQLIESSRRWPIRRFRSTLPYRTETDFGRSSSRMEDRLLQDIIDRSTGMSAVHKPAAENLTPKDSEDEKEDRVNAVANFECNVCLEMAKEPVVTSCGHLFCWPCLYQWLYLHSDHKECPVCKGEVTDSNITPIYGRGSTETKDDKKSGVIEDSGLEVPPRPHGRRLESLRQRSRRSLPRISREQFMSWGHIINEEIQNGSRAEGQESSQNGIFDGLNRRVLTRLLAAQQIQGEGSSENGNLGASRSSRNAPEPASNFRNSNSHVDETHGRQRSSSLLRDRFDFWRRIALYSLPGTDAFAAFASRMSNFLETTNNGNNSGPSALVNPLNHEPPLGQGTQGAASVGDQPSASSTMAVIQGAGGALDASAEQNSAGSSRSLRRRRRNLASSSLDVDGQVHHARKRRRLN
ncbi:hypothetical protein ACLOJK_033754 [Asimina triloba]